MTELKRSDSNDSDSYSNILAHLWCNDVVQNIMYFSCFKLYRKSNLQIRCCTQCLNTDWRDHTIMHETELIPSTSHQLNFVRSSLMLSFSRSLLLIGCEYSIDFPRIVCGGDGFNTRMCRDIFLSNKSHHYFTQSVSLGGRLRIARQYFSLSWVEIHALLFSASQLMSGFCSPYLKNLQEIVTHHMSQTR
jgi:hypothetical protein